MTGNGDAVALGASASLTGATLGIRYGSDFWATQDPGWPGSDGDIRPSKEQSEVLPGPVKTAPAGVGLFTVTTVTVRGRRGSVFGRTVTSFTAVLRESMDDAKSSSRLMKDEWKPLPAIMPPRSGIALSLWQCYKRIKLIVLPLYGHFRFWNACFASVGHCSLLNFKTISPMYFLKLSVDYALWCRTVAVYGRNWHVPYRLAIRHTVPYYGTKPPYRITAGRVQNEHKVESAPD
ncbi:hypothetical protein B0H19DRAFT_1078170 [Mycena capillaripes]|nr:hypothetical protein B0H19DRAFT_1078170 [Mycena capillaripes]